MQGAEAALLLTICFAVCVFCMYSKEYAVAFLVLFFGDFLAIQGKVYFGYQALGVYKEGILLSICFALLFYARQSFSNRLFRMLLIIFACGILAISGDYRPYSALILAAVMGILVAECGGRITPPVAALTISCFAICAYQFLNVTDFQQLWFYDFLAEKAGQEFLSTYHAYFRNDKLRPPGFLVSPSTFGFVFLLFSYLVEKQKITIHLKMFVKLVCLAALLMIQTRALLIIFIAFEIQQRIFPNMRNVRVLLYYFLVLVTTIFVTVMFGDEGSLVRILLFTGLVSDIASGIGWLPFESKDTAPVDSQFVSFVRAFGLLGIVALIYIVRSIKRTGAYSNRAGNIELAFVCVLLFVNIFQWSESSPGNLLGWLMLGYYARKNKISLRRQYRHQDLNRKRRLKNESNNIHAFI